MNSGRVWLVSFSLAIVAILQWFISANGLHEDLYTAYTEGLRVKDYFVPYRDYLSHNTPVLPLLIGLAMRVFGNDVGYLVISCVGSSLTWWVCFKISKAVPLTDFQSALMAFIGTLWMFFQVGGAYYDHAAILCAAISLTCIVSYYHTRRIFYLIWCGCWAAITFFSKTTIGSLCIVLIGIFVLVEYRLLLIYWLLGLLTPFLIFVFWVNYYSDPALMIQSIFIQPLEYRSYASNKNISGIIKFLTEPYLINPFSAFEKGHFGALFFYVGFIPFVIATYFITVSNVFSIFSKSFEFRRILILGFFCSFLSAGVVGRNFIQAAFLVPIFSSLLILSYVRGEYLRKRIFWLIFFNFLFVGSVFLSREALEVEHRDLGSNCSDQQRFIKYNILDLPYSNADSVIRTYNFICESLSLNSRFAFYDDNLRILSSALEIPSFARNVSLIDRLAIPVNPASRRNWVKAEVEWLVDREVDYLVFSFGSSDRRYRVKYETPPGFSGEEFFLQEIERSFQFIYDINGVWIFERRR